MRFICNCTVAGLLAAAAPAAAQPTSSAPQTFNIFLNGQQIGTEEVTLKGSLEGWTITSSGRLGAPLNIVTRQFEMRYDLQWHPKELTIDAAVNAEPMRLHTTFSGTSAVNEITQRGQTTPKTDPVAADTVVLPNPFFGAVEALAARLAKVTPPSDLKAYIAPQAEITINVKTVAGERIQMGSQSTAARRFTLTFNNPSSKFDAEVLIDQGGRLLRLQVPAQALDVIRQDIASVAARVERAARANDEIASIPASGFTLAGTISKPAGATGRLPAVVLIAGSGAGDRDEVVAGIPIFGLLANALADAGFLVVRYDKRGVGQSGGRLEASTLADYADDARAAVRFVRGRKDVDQKRIALVGHSEGGAVALIAASKEDRVAAVATIGTPGTPGLDLILEQQQHALSRSKLTEAEKQTAVDFQKKLLQAVISGEGWEGVPPDVRRRVDTPWYRSLLLFDPAAVMKNVKQPLLVVQGELDTQAPPHHGDRLIALASARKGRRSAEIRKIPGVNHLMVAATTGEADEYATLKDKTLSRSVLSALTEWLKATLIPRS